MSIKKNLVHLYGTCINPYIYKKSATIDYIYVVHSEVGIYNYCYHHIHNTWHKNSLTSTPHPNRPPIWEWIPLKPDNIIAR
jgi:hypothetical protein